MTKDDMQAESNPVLTSEEMADALKLCPDFPTFTVRGKPLSELADLMFGAGNWRVVLRDGEDGRLNDFATYPFGIPWIEALRAGLPEDAYLRVTLGEGGVLLLSRSVEEG